MDISAPRHHTLDRGNDAVEPGDLFAESPAAARGDGVVAGASPGRRFTPFADDPPILLESGERGIERAVIDGEDTVRQPRNVLYDRVSMHRLQGERFENQHLECAFEQLVLLRFGPRHAWRWVKGRNPT